MLAEFAAGLQSKTSKIHTHTHTLTYYSLSSYSFFTMYVCMYMYVYLVGPIRKIKPIPAETGKPLTHLSSQLQVLFHMYIGCAVLLCLVVCLTLLASFFLPSHLSLKHV